ncbi:MAG: hypothetical protein HY670_05900 [Chloroflexi bacterium]|nr:hypothetical protein [Chloroflexota bacterium]
MNVGILPLIASIVSLIFGLAVLDQYFARRKPYQLLWAIALFMYCVSTFTEFLAESYGVSDAIYRLWYLFGAILVAAYLGMGTLYLLVKRGVAHIIMALLLLISVYAAFKVFTVDLDLSGLQRFSGRILPDDIRSLSRYLSYIGALVLVGGALYSSWVFLRRKILPHRVSSNILIAVGVLLPAIGGGIMRAADAFLLFYLFELAGIIIIFIGFLRSREVFGLYRIPFRHGFHKLPEQT